MTDTGRVHYGIHQIPAMEYPGALDAILDRIIYTTDQMIPWPQNG